MIGKPLPFQLWGPHTDTMPNWWLKASHSSWRSASASEEYEERHGPRNAYGRQSIKIMVSGRLGAGSTRSESYHEAHSLQTIRADIDYGFAEAATTSAASGKVWIYKGEVLSQTLRTTPRQFES